MSGPPAERHGRANSEPRPSGRAGRGGAYFLTWTTYATWLPGHEAGFVSRIPTRDGHAIHNEVATPYTRDWPKIKHAAELRQAGPRVVLDVQAAAVCMDSFRSTEAGHDLCLLAFAVMPTHVHLVVRSPCDEGARMLQLFKGAASRRLSERFGRPDSGRWWTRSGSRRLLTTSNSIRSAVVYVRDQERPLVVWTRNR